MVAWHTLNAGEWIFFFNATFRGKAVITTAEDATLVHDLHTVVVVAGIFFECPSFMTLLAPIEMVVATAVDETLSFVVQLKGKVTCHTVFLPVFETARAIRLASAFN